MWNDWGRALEIGAETVADTISDILFEDCDIIHHVHYAMDIQNGDRAVVRNVTYRNIRVEEPITDRAQIAERAYDQKLLGHLIDLNIRENPYSKDTIRGKIQDITYRDIYYSGSRFSGTSMTGYGPGNRVEGIRFENIFLRGEKVTDRESLGLSANEHVGEVIIK